MKVTTKGKKDKAASAEPGGTEPQPNTSANEGADTTAPAPTAKKKKKKGFTKGQSGNPGGRPPGSKNRGTLMAQALISGQSVKIIERLVEQAIEGQPAAQKLAVERIIPRTMSRLISFDLPPTDTAADLAIAHDAVLDATTHGELALDEAKAISELLESKHRLLKEDFSEQLTILEDRISELEDSKD